MSRPPPSALPRPTLIYNASPTDPVGPGLIIPKPLPRSTAAAAAAATASSSTAADPHSTTASAPALPAPSSRLDAAHSSSPAIARSSPLFPLFALWQSVARVVVPDSLAVDAARARAAAPALAPRLAPRVAQLRPLDIILVRTPGAVYASLRSATKQPYDHLGIVLADTATFLHIGPPVVRVLATQVLLDPARSPLVLRPRVRSPAAAAALLAELQALVGSPYKVSRAYAIVARTAVESATGLALPLPPPAAARLNMGSFSTKTNAITSTSTSTSTATVVTRRESSDSSNNAAAPARVTAAPVVAAPADEAFICSDSIMERLLRYSPALSSLAEAHRSRLHIGTLGAWTVSDIMLLHAEAVKEQRQRRDRALQAVLSRDNNSVNADTKTYAGSTESHSSVDGLSEDSGDWCALEEVPLPPAPSLPLSPSRSLPLATSAPAPQSQSHLQSQSPVWQSVVAATAQAPTSAGLTTATGIPLTSSTSPGSSLSQSQSSGSGSGSGSVSLSGSQSQTGVGRATIGAAGVVSLLRGLAASLADAGADATAAAAARDAAARARARVARAGRRAAAAGRAGAGVVAGMVAAAAGEAGARLVAAAGTVLGDNNDNNNLNSNSNSENTESKTDAGVGSESAGAAAAPAVAMAPSAAMSTKPLRARVVSAAGAAALAAASRARALAAAADGMIDSVFARAEGASLDWLASKGFLDDAESATVTRINSSNSGANSSNPRASEPTARSSDAKSGGWSAAAAAVARAGVAAATGVSGTGDSNSLGGGAGAAVGAAWAEARLRAARALRLAAVRTLYGLLRRLWAVAKPALRVYVILYILSFKFPWLLLLRTRLMKGLLALNIIGALAGARGDGKDLPERLRRRPMNNTANSMTDKSGGGGAAKEKLDAKL